MARASPIRSLDPDERLPLALRRIFVERAREVRRYARQVQDTCSFTSIHDLRVSIRRLLALLKAFRSCLVSEHYEQIHGQLKTLLGALGTLRERDVFVEMLQNASDAKRHPRDPFVSGLRASYKKLRGQYAAEILTMLRILDENGFWQLMNTTFRSISNGETTLRAVPDRRLSFRKNGRLIVAPLARRFVRRRSEVLGHRRRKKELHRLRIAGKSLRYAMEVFEVCYGKAFRQCLSDVEKVVERLGLVHDYDVFILLVRKYRDAHPEFASSVARIARSMLDEATEKRRQTYKSLSRTMKNLGGQRFYRRIAETMDGNG